MKLFTSKGYYKVIISIDIINKFIYWLYQIYYKKSFSSYSKRVREFRKKLTLLSLTLINLHFNNKD